LNHRSEAKPGLFCFLRQAQDEFWNLELGTWDLGLGSWFFVFCSLFPSTSSGGVLEFGICDSGLGLVFGSFSASYFSGVRCFLLVKCINSVGLVDSKNINAIYPLRDHV